MGPTRITPGEHGARPSAFPRAAAAPRAVLHAISVQASRPFPNQRKVSTRASGGAIEKANAARSAAQGDAVARRVADLATRFP